jgi:hypothetical protein
MAGNAEKVARTVRSLLPYTTAALVIALVYTGWVFFSRWSENRRLEQTAAEQRHKLDKDITDKYGSGALKILSFYANPGIVARGQKTLLCYGVVNAKSVRIEPLAERVWPAVTRCLEITALRETRFTLTAEDDQGHSATESFVLQVR